MLIPFWYLFMTTLWYQFEHGFFAVSFPSQEPSSKRKLSRCVDCITNPRIVIYQTADRKTVSYNIVLNIIRTNYLIAAVPFPIELRPQCVPYLSIIETGVSSGQQFKNNPGFNFTKIVLRTLLGLCKSFKN